MRFCAIKSIVLFILLSLSIIELSAQEYEEWNGEKKLEVIYDSTYSLLLKTELIMSGMNYNFLAPTPRKIIIHQKLIRRDSDEVLFKSKSRRKFKGCIGITKKQNKIELHKDDSGFTLTSKFFNTYKYKTYDNTGNLISIEKI